MECLTTRNELVKLIKPDSIGIELGVRHGIFSKYLLAHSSLKILYSIDRWTGDRGHDMSEFRDTRKALSDFKERSEILRVSFKEALHLFQNSYFDFIYIDGYAHDGEAGAIDDWWIKLKPGGIYSGHDYNSRFPLVVKAVNNLVSKYSLQLYKTRSDQYNSWYCRK